MNERLSVPVVIGIATPSTRLARSGNRITALRWAGLLRQLGCRPFVEEHWSGRPCQVLIAVHAHKSASSVLASVQRQPGTPVVVLLSGTDVYPEFCPSADTNMALQLASSLIALQPDVQSRLPHELRGKVEVILQSAKVTAGTPPADAFQACVLAHLRDLKRPLLAAEAARLTTSSQLRIVLAGRALAPAQAAAAEREMRLNPRFRWLGELRRADALRLLANSHVGVVSSTSEGGANVVSEAIAAGVPVLATAIPGNTGILGADWPGLFPIDDAPALASLLQRAENDPAFLAELRARTRALQPLVEPARERAAWRELLVQLGFS